MELEDYKKEELQNHIYKTPDTYVGGCDLIEENLPIYDGNNIVFKDGEYIPAVYNIYNEILVNARDQIVRIEGRKKKSDKPVQNLKVPINREKGEISIYNDGTGIDIAQHQKKTIKVIYGSFNEIRELLTLYYQNRWKKIVGGEWLWAKLTNIFLRNLKQKQLIILEKRNLFKIFRKIEN